MPHSRLIYVVSFLYASTARSANIEEHSYTSSAVHRVADQVEDDDEVLLVMADELGGFVPLVGGPYEATCLMQPLGALATVEETVVRDKAVESACIVIGGLDNALVIDHVMPVVMKLAQGDWFTARVSACGLVAATYSRLSDAGARTTLRGLYATLAADDTPMVRRAAAKHIGGFAAIVERNALLSDLLPLFSALAADDQDSVRLLAIENCTAFARVLNAAENATTTLPLVKACASDKSWRVRNNVAKEFAPVRPIDAWCRRNAYASRCHVPSFAKIDPILSRPAALRSDGFASDSRRVATSICQAIAGALPLRFKFALTASASITVVATCLSPPHTGP